MAPSQSRMSPYASPLRYPGGKRKLANFIKLVIRANNLLGGTYVEPYAGGAAVALSLLYSEYVSRAVINDLDRSIYAFWWGILEEPDALCKRIRTCHVDMDEWYRQRSIQDSESPDLLDLAFSTFFLNRTNRSGIIRGGVIGGKAQTGKWKLDARFNREDLILRIQKVSRYRKRIELYNLDAVDLIEALKPRLGPRSLVYLDPPYYEKGSDLYENHYLPEDHATIASLVRTLKTPWLVTYDSAPSIEELYHDSGSLRYGLNYSAQQRYEGSELLFYPTAVRIPPIGDPARISQQEYESFQESF